MKIVVVDGQGGGMGKLLTERLGQALPGADIVAVGTNAMATSAMLRAGAGAGATGENAVIVAARDADVIVGPVGIVLADALMGEVTPAMAAAVGASAAHKVLLPVAKCRVSVAGARDLPLTALAEEAVKEVVAFAGAATACAKS